MSESEPISRADVDRLIEITSRDTGYEGVVVLSVSGELDLLTAEVLDAQLKDAISPPNKLVVLDLSEIQFLGSAALSSLLVGAEAAKSRGIEFHLVATERVVIRPIEITGVSSSFTIFDSVDAALAAAGYRPDGHA